MIIQKNKTVPALAIQHTFFKIIQELALTWDLGSGYTHVHEG